MNLSLAVIFWAMVAISAVTGGLIFIPGLKKYRPFRVLAALILALSILGGVMILLVLKYEMSGTLRYFLILAGISPAAMVVSVILHNAISGLLTALLKREMEEAVFFLLGLFGCPATFLIGVMGSIILIIKGAV